MYANSNCASAYAKQTAGLSGQKGDNRSATLNRLAHSLVCCVPHAVKCSRFARRGHKYVVENQYTNKHNNENYEVLIRKFQRFVTSVSKQFRRFKVYFLVMCESWF